jgi:cell division septation protein DedD
MKKITHIPKRILAILFIISAFGLASCATTPPIDGNPDPGSVQKEFVVQLIASSSQAKANQIKTTFAREGYATSVNPLVVNGKTLYRVQIGPYATEAEAQAVLTKMKQRYQRNGYVKNAVIKEK